MSGASSSTELAGEGLNVLEFLSSAAGRRTYSFWESGALTDARVVRDFGSSVLAGSVPKHPPHGFVFEVMRDINPARS